VFTAAVERRTAGQPVWAIGVDFDQAAGAQPDVAAVILTSAVRPFDGVVYWAAEQYAAGNLTGGEVDLGIAEGAVSYTTTGGFLDAILTDLEDLAAGIADGSIVVPEQP
jgi:basic membrane protein A